MSVRQPLGITPASFYRDPEFSRLLEARKAASSKLEELARDIASDIVCKGEEPSSRMRELFLAAVAAEEAIYDQLDTLRQAHVDADAAQERLPL